MKPLQNISKWALLRWAEVVLLVALFSGVLILINVIAYKNSKRFDLTPGKRYSLSPQSAQILNALTDDLTVTISYKKGDKSSLQDLLELFSQADSRFHYHLLDLDKNPAKAQTLGIRDYGAGVAEYQNRKETIRSLTEENLVNAILRLTDSSEKTVRFVTGHGEKSLAGEDNKTSYSTVKNALELENYRAEELSLLQAKKIPDDTLILVIGGPRSAARKLECHHPGPARRLGKPVGLAQELERLGLGLNVPGSAIFCLASASLSQRQESVAPARRQAVRASRITNV